MPNYGQGMNEQLLLGFETSFKTMPGTVNADKVPVVNPSIKPSRNKFQSNSLTGSPQPRPVVFGKIGVDGTLRVECNPISLMPVLKGLFGTPTSQQCGTNYDWTYTLGTMPSMWIEQGHSDVSRFFLVNGAYIGSASFDFAVEGLMEADFSFVGGKLTVANTTAVNGSTTDRTGLAPIEYIQGRIKQGGAVIGYTQDVRLDINRNLQKEFAQDQTTEVATIFSQVASVSGRLTALFQDTTLFALSMSGAETSLEIFVPFSSGYGLLVYMPTVKLEPGEVVTSGTGIVKVDFSFTAYARGTSSATAGYVRSQYFSGPVTVNTGNDLIAVKVDGGSIQNVTLTNGSRTVDQIVTDLQAGLTGATVSVERLPNDAGGRFIIQSNTTGTASSVQIDVTTEAEATYGFDNSVHAGLSNQSIIFTLMNGASS
jgi:hypothetical protein